MDKKSCGMGLFTIAHCLRSGALLAGNRKPNWQSPETDRHSFQHRFSALLPKMYGGLEAFKRDEIQGLASLSAEEINAWLEAKGSPLRVQQWLNDGICMGMASILDIIVKWLTVCELTTVHVPEVDAGREYPAFTVEGENGLSGVFETKNHSEPIAAVATQNGDTVYFTRWRNTEVLEDADVPFVIAEIRAGMKRSRDRYSEVTVPMVNLTLEPDINWVVGLTMETKKGSWSIVKAKQRLRFGMNQFGARTREETVMEATLRGMFYKPIVLDGTFLCWFERSGVELPYVNLLCAPDCFGDPGDLTKMV